MLRNLIFLGPPGAGKGTIATLAVKKLAIPHISTGDIFRYNIKNKTPLGLQVEAILASGSLVTDKLTNELIENRLGESDVSGGFILDGYPRTLIQAEALNHFKQIDAVINFVIDEQEIIRRLSGRRTCSNCGAAYHIESMPSKQLGQCDRCDGALITRKDDEPQAIKIRLDVYRTSTQPLINYYQEQGKLLNIDSMLAPEHVLEKFLAMVNT